MQLGFVSAILPDLSLQEVFETAAHIGYDCVELMCWPAGEAERRYAGVTHVEMDGFDDARAKHVRQLAVDSGVAISGLGYYPNPLSADFDEAGLASAHIRKVVAACDMLDIRQMNTFVGRDPSKSVDDNWSRFLKVWIPLVQIAEDRNVRIGIENCPMLFTSDEWPGGKNLAVSPAIWRRMFEAIPSGHFGLNYDPSHMVWQQMDYESPIRDFADRIFHVHAKDVRVDRYRLDDVGILSNPLEYHSPKLPGLGEINWGRFVSVLGDSGFDGPICVEVEDSAYEDSLVSRTTALRQSYTYLRNFIPLPDN